MVSRRLTGMHRVPPTVALVREQLDIATQRQSFRKQGLPQTHQDHGVQWAPKEDLC